jgi:diaminopimelate epimerase
MKSPLPFTKMQSVGNDFVVLETAKWPTETDWNAQAVRLCDRRFGIGADGLMLLMPSESAAIRMRMFNPDGTEDMCGNGMRCVLHLAKERGLVGTSGTIETPVGLRHFTLRDDGTIRTEMGLPSFDAAAIPFLGAESEQGTLPFLKNIVLPHGDRHITLSGVVNTGSTHTVLLVDELPDDETFLFWSPYIENHPLFPERTSVMWTKILSPSLLRLRIWERGVGETLGCGTGASAAAVIARLMADMYSGPLQVQSAGGTLTVEWDGNATHPNAAIYLTGTAQITYAGHVLPD